MLTGMGDTQSSNNAPASWWDAFLQFWNPSIPTSTLAANYYQGAQYGVLPTIPEPSATTTPQDQAQAVQNAIAQAATNGTYNTSPSLGVTATDLSNVPTSTYVLAAIGVGALVLVMTAKGKR